ncbi:hypothetical protein CSC2_48340 [Clostridium zeae]|uniref:DUF3784 domain-containing protein n=1 Tax=Clostridium zeae TaxID=2759022 RepID=A0ABQ1EID1_9CLOT|nr:hypothetical protein [Clostridium zeae]GFZ34308.1 hypothetical protein CSC2_48340 [Clostridium zeae]
MIDYNMLNGIIHGFLYKTMPILIAMGIGMVLYSFFDKRFNITNWINLRMKIEQKWKPLACFLSIFLFQFIITLIGIYIIDIPSIIYFVMSGLLVGSTLNFIDKIKNLKI